MPGPVDSFKKFNYSLRPSKQVERKIMIDILLAIAGAGYPIRTYRYVGFGSVYYADFVMFHKYLYVDQMTCVEYSDIPRRMKFNKPYDFIRLRMQSLSDALPHVIRPRSKYIAWVDYDEQLDGNKLRDIDDCVLRLPTQSIFAVTVDARARVPKDVLAEEDMDQRQQRRWLLNKFNDEFSEVLDRKVVADDLEPAGTPQLYVDTILARIRESLLSREGVEYIQLFNYLYADGAPMLTIGGMLGTAEDRERLNGLLEHEFVAPGRQSMRISVPPLTSREKLWLDSNLSGNRMRFELDDDFLENYRRFYRHYPTFVETIT